MTIKAPWSYQGLPYDSSLSPFFSGWMSPLTHTHCMWPWLKLNSMSQVSTVSHQHIYCNIVRVFINFIWDHFWSWVASIKYQQKSLFSIYLVIFMYCMFWLLSKQFFIHGSELLPQFFEFFEVASALSPTQQFVQTIQHIFIDFSNPSAVRAFPWSALRMSQWKSMWINPPVLC